jgi:hypothetical protein
VVVLDEGIKSMTYRFRVGKAITVKPDHNLNVPGGAYEVVKRLPGTSGEPEYRIKARMNRISASLWRAS